MEAAAGPRTQRRGPVVRSRSIQVGTQLRPTRSGSACGKGVHVRGERRSALPEPGCSVPFPPKQPTASSLGSESGCRRTSTGSPTRRRRLRVTVQ